MSPTASDISFVDSNKGRKQLIRNGFVFKSNKQTASKVYWICKQPNCAAKVYTDLNHNYLYANGEHNHLLEPEDVEVQLFRTALKERVVNETTPISKLYDEEITKRRFKCNTLINIPMFQEIQPGLNQARRKLTPILPSSNIFDIPNGYSMTTLGEQFLICDAVVSRKKRLLIFASPKQIEMLCESSVLFMDGTFLSTPPFFDQVFTIHGLKFDFNFPCVFALLPDRKKATYQFLFRELKRVVTSSNRTLEPGRIVTDFETSLIPAIAAEFPDSQHQGCYFHHSQAIYRQIQALGLAKSYAEDDEMRHCCRKLMALALLPVDEVETSFYHLRSTTDSRVKTQLRKLFLYFDDYWINTIPLKMWNVHGHEHRTNNISEGYHSRLNRRIERSHGNIWSFIRCLIGEESRFQHLYVKMNTGAQRRPRTTATDRIQKRLDTLNERFSNGEITVEVLLDGLSSLVMKKK